MATTFRGSTSSWRTLGSAATPHNLFTLENTTGSAVVVRVRRLIVLCDQTVVLTSVMPQIKVSRPTAIPTGGTVLAKASFDTSLSSAANVIARGANASDGGVATAITATAGDTAWQQYVFRLHTAVGQVLAPDFPLLPPSIDTDPFLLAANQAMLVQLVASAGSSNPATDHWIVCCSWEETT